MDIVNHQYSILSWNVRGLSSRAKQEDVKQLVSMCKPDLIC
jgi:exonuclease III